MKQFQRFISFILILFISLILPIQISHAEEQIPFSFIDSEQKTEADKHESVKTNSTFAKETITINSGIRVPISIYNTVSSNNLNDGDMIGISVDSNVKVDNKLIFRKGNEGVLFVSHSKKSRGHGGKGKLEINGGRITDIFGNDYPISLSIQRKGNGKRGWAIVASILGVAMILVPFGIWIDGKPATLQGGAKFDAFTTSPKVIELPEGKL